MISPIPHYIKIGVSLQAETKRKKILTSLQTSVTILFCWTKIKQGDLHRVILAVKPYIHT